MSVFPAGSRLAQAARLSLHALLVAAAVYGVVYVLVVLRLVVLPVIGALMVATILEPVSRRLRRRLPDALAAGLPMLVAALVVLGIIGGIVPVVSAEVGTLGVSARTGLDQVIGWLTTGPLGLTQVQIDQTIQRAIDQVGARGDLVAGGVVTGARLVGELITGILLAVVVLFFMLKDGERIWSWVVGLFPERGHRDVREIGDRAWTALSGYVRGVAVVAIIDAVLIGVALLVIGVPLVVPLMVLTFFGAFIPLAGAVIAGAVAALVALVTKGVVAALLVVAAITIVQQLEGDLVYPLVVGRAIQLHALAILLVVTAGFIVAGIVGAVLSVPLAASVWAAVSYLRERTPAGGAAPPTGEAAS